MWSWFTFGISKVSVFQKYSVTYVVIFIVGRITVGSLRLLASSCASMGTWALRQQYKYMHFHHSMRVPCPGAKQTLQAEKRRGLESLASTKCPQSTKLNISAGNNTFNSLPRNQNARFITCFSMTDDSSHLLPTTESYKTTHRRQNDARRTNAKTR